MSVYVAVSTIGSAMEDIVQQYAVQSVSLCIFLPGLGTAHEELDNLLSGMAQVCLILLQAGGQIRRPREVPSSLLGCDLHNNK